VSSLILINCSFAAHEIWSYFKEIENGLFTQSCSLFSFKFGKYSENIYYRVFDATHASQINSNRVPRWSASLKRRTHFCLRLQSLAALVCIFYSSIVWSVYFTSLVHRATVISCQLTTIACPVHNSILANLYFVYFYLFNYVWLNSSSSNGRNTWSASKAVNWKYIFVDCCIEHDILRGYILHYNIYNATHAADTIFFLHETWNGDCKMRIIVIYPLHV